MVLSFKGKDFLKICHPKQGGRATNMQRMQNVGQTVKRRKRVNDEEKEEE